MIRVSSSGSFNNTEIFLKKMKKGTPYSVLDKYGQKGVDALAKATPVDSGLTAADWYYTTSKKNGRYSISWHNKNVVTGVPVVILIRYGHATNGGGWVEGRDFVSPAIRPIFDKIAADVWEEVKKNG